MGHPLSSQNLKHTYKKESFLIQIQKMGHHLRKHK